MSQKTDHRIIRTEKTIIEAGIEALLNNPSASMSEIAELAGIGRATLYRHFRSREDLIGKLARICLEEIDAAVKPYEHLAGRALIEAIIVVTVPMANRFRFLISLWSFVRDDKEIKNINARMNDEMGFVFDQAKQLGEIRLDLPTPWIVALFNATLGAAWASIEEGKLTSDDAVRHAKQSFFQGCGTIG